MSPYQHPLRDNPVSDTNHIFGLHAVEALLKRNPDRVYRLCITKDRQDKKLQLLLDIAKQHGITIEPNSKESLDKITNDANHQGIVAFCRKPKSYTEHDLVELLSNTDTPPFVLILDGVQDPHNLGACFRSADAAGVHVIIAPKDKSVGITPVVSKVASGATESVSFVQVTNLVRAMEIIKEMGIWIYGAAGEAETSLFKTKLTGPIAIALGSEGEGLRRLTREHCDVLLKIPMTGTAESLNVSVATGIFLFEVVRQRAL